MLKKEEKESATEAANHTALEAENSALQREAEAEREREDDEELERWNEKEEQLSWVFRSSLIHLSPSNWRKLTQTHDYITINYELVITTNYY